MCNLNTKKLSGYDYLILNEAVLLVKEDYRENTIDNLKKRLLVKKHSKWNMCIEEKRLNCILSSLQCRGYLHIESNYVKCNVEEIELLLRRFNGLREASRLLIWEQISEVDYEIYVAILLCKLRSGKIDMNGIRNITDQNPCIVDLSVKNLIEVELLVE